ncbi:hypothetical protein [Caballeronia sp. LZ065]|uniref:hypothetical protein n=1 Tax=Caballeronia sp. LZ065 TaxID=3038571 RepID=UPI00286D1F6D|nr:hypothetical protein [Caballeronia sp. LZ065]
MAALKATVVIEDVVVDDFTDGCARRTACGSAEESTNNGACDQPEDGADRAADHASGRANFCARHGGGCSACRTGDRANCAARLPCVISRFDLF